MRQSVIRRLVFILSAVIFILFSAPLCVFADEAPLSARNSDSPAEITCVEESDDCASPQVWRATRRTFLGGRLIYKKMNIWVAPGMKDTGGASWDLTKSAGRDYRDTVMKFPDTAKTIYASGLIQNYLEYKLMVGENWQFAKLSADDFADAGHSYATEGNWGLLQTGYYCLKGTSRVVWALGILNSGEAVWKIVQAGGETVYYLLRYPVGGVLKTAAAPVVLVGGTAWSTIASVVTTGWALPFAAVYDTLGFAGGAVMARIAAALLLLGLVCPSVVSADSRIFLGTRTGWARSGETFTCGKYKDTRLFLVIGTRPTTDAVCAIYDWETGSTFVEDIKGGARFFNKQAGESASSVPENALLLGGSVGDLALDPVREIQDFSILSPAKIIGKTVINIIKIGWYAVKLPVEPVLRTGAGTLAMAGSPFVQPVLYTGKYTLLTVVAAYGYTSSAVGGGVLLGATGGVCALDIATSPFVACYEVFAD